MNADLILVMDRGRIVPARLTLGPGLAAWLKIPAGTTGVVVTEVRPGNYVFYDATQAAIGSCTTTSRAERA